MEFPVQKQDDGRDCDGCQESHLLTRGMSELGGTLGMPYQDPMIYRWGN